MADKYGRAQRQPVIAYFSMEFGLTECLQNYSGGLGVLSGDHLKSASDLGIPLVGVGILYQEGYFQQYLNADGFQLESYPLNDYVNQPVKLQTDSSAGRPQSKSPLALARARALRPDLEGAGRARGNLSAGQQYR